MVARRSARNIFYRRRIGQKIWGNASRARAAAGIRLSDLGLSCAHARKPARDKARGRHLRWHGREIANGSAMSRRPDASGAALDDRLRPNYLRTLRRIGTAVTAAPNQFASRI